MNQSRALILALLAGAALFAAAPSMPSAVAKTADHGTAKAAHVASEESAPAAKAQDMVADAPVDAGRKACGELSANWYDGETDSLTPLTFYDWPSWKPWDLSSILKLILWSGLASLVILLAVLLYVLLRNRPVRGADESSATTRRAGLAADQVEALPFLAERRRDDLLGQARFHYQQGNYSEAIIYLFSYQLVELDKSSLIRLAKGKTNRQYLREAARVAALGRALEGTMNSFEAVFFGRRQLDRAGFEVCWHNLPQFEEQLRAATP